MANEDRLETVIDGIKTINSKGVVTVEIGKIIIRDQSYLSAATLQAALLNAFSQVVEAQIGNILGTSEGK